MSKEGSSLPDEMRTLIRRLLVIAVILGLLWIAGAGLMSFFSLFNPMLAPFGIDFSPPK